MLVKEVGEIGLELYADGQHLLRQRYQHLTILVVSSYCCKVEFMLFLFGNKKIIDFQRCLKFHKFRCTRYSSKLEFSALFVRILPILVVVAELSNLFPFDPKVSQDEWIHIIPFQLKDLLLPSVLNAERFVGLAESYCT
jgi:hypothetical protein